MKVRWSSVAEADLAAVLEYLEHERPAAAQRFLRAVDDACRQLARFPQSARPVPELQPEDEEALQREVIIRPYRMGYTVTRKELVILYVVHSARRFPPIR